MKQLMPIKRFVVEITNQAISNDQQQISKAVRAFHNKLYNGSIPRDLIIKIGRDLFIDLGAWGNWLEKKKQKTDAPSPGRPRTT